MTKQININRGILESDTCGVRPGIKFDDIVKFSKEDFDGKKLTYGYYINFRKPQWITSIFFIDNLFFREDGTVSWFMLKPSFSNVADEDRFGYCKRWLSDSIQMRPYKDEDDEIIYRFGWGWVSCSINPESKSSDPEIKFVYTNI